MGICRLVNKIFFIIVFILYMSINICPYEVSSDVNLIKRNVIILPFINSNKDAEYDYLKDVIRDAIKTNLLITDQFNITNPLQINKKIIEMGYKEDDMMEPSIAIDISKSFESDVVVIGKYLTIERKIMIQIDALDVFTGETVVSINKADNLGINLLILIDEVSKDLSDKMVLKFPRVDRSYFSEMMNLIEKERKIKENTGNIYGLNSFNISGIGLCITGSALFIAGISILSYDLAGYSDTLRYYKNIYDNTGSGYNDYDNSYNIFVGLFCSGVVSAASGLIMSCISIPLLLYKKKNNKISLNFEINNRIHIIFSYKL